MVTLAHLSDVHLAPLPPVHPWQLANKRITGYLNWQFNRARHMQRDTLANLINHLKIQRPNITTITGDLVNLGLESEFTSAVTWLENIGGPNKVCVIPGNHDAYTPGDLANFRRIMGYYSSGELLDSAPFPYVRRLGEIAVIGCSSAIATPPFMAYGRFDQPQAERLSKCLKLLGDGEFFRVVLIHHPPNEELADDKRRGLRGADLFRDVIKQQGAELILHGHSHRSSTNALAGTNGEVPVIGVAAGSANANSGEDPARYNFFNIERIGDSWSCTLNEYGYQRIGNEIVTRLEMRIY